MRHVALLRGINLGSRHRVPMAELRSLLSEAGYGDVRTYVQSGNIVLSSSATAADVELALHGLISERFGFDVPVIVRSREQLGKIVQADPIPEAADDPKHYVVCFVARAPADAVIATLESAASGSEVLHPAGTTIYAWFPDGQARSKLSLALTGKALGPNATARNWRTVTTLLEMASE